MCYNNNNNTKIYNAHIKSIKHESEAVEVLCTKHYLINVSLALTDRHPFNGLLLNQSGF